MVPRLKEQWVGLHRKRPRYLFHYTNALGLLGILESGRIWATNSRFMNDPTEITYATGLVRQVMEHELHGKKKRSFAELEETVSELLEKYEANAKVYISCFCTKGDLLSQWRGYGAVGGGYALGFVGRDMGALEVTSSEQPEPILRRVIYDQKQQVLILTNWLRGLSILASERHKTSGAERLNRAWREFLLFLSECMNCFKDPAYQEEQEWRIIQFGRVGGRDVVNASFRTGVRHVVPFVKLDLTLTKGRDRGKLPLKHIHYGPTLEPHTTERSLQLLCEARGYNKDRLTIGRSGVPFTS